MTRDHGTGRRVIRRTGRIMAGVGVVLTTALGTGAFLTVASAVGQSTPAGADTPSYLTTCHNVPNIGTVEYPTVVAGSIPTAIGNGIPFNISGFQVTVTVPASVTTVINDTAGANAVISSSFGITIDATGATPSSQPVTVNFPDTVVPASGSFNIVGTTTSPLDFTGTGASVSITPGPSITGFESVVDGISQPTYNCTTPSPEPVIAFAAGSNGPYAFVADPGPNLITPIDTATGTEGTPFDFNDYEPDALAITPDGQTAYVVPAQADQDSEITPVNTDTDAIGTPINTGDPVSAVAITPDGSTAYAVSYQDDAVVPIDLATQTAGTPIPVGTDPTAIAITPDGSTAYVVNQQCSVAPCSSPSTVTPVDLAHQTAGAPITVGVMATAIAITPDGSTAYVVNNCGSDLTCSGGDGSVTPIDTTTDSAGTPIATNPFPIAIAVTADGSTAYVSTQGDGVVIPIDTATDTTGVPISVGDPTSAIAVTPGGSTLYVAMGGDDTVIPIDTASDTVGTPIGAGTDPEAIAITPDQGPSAALTAAVSGDTATFDASASLPGTSPIVSYAWNFGDGNTDTTTVPTDSHTYAGGGTYTTTVTETDAEGTSTTQSFTGQTVSQDGSTAAEASGAVVIATTDCSDQSSCSVALTTPATPQTPSQTIGVTAPAPGQPTQQLTATSGPGQLECTTKDFGVPGDVTSYGTTFTPTSNVTVTDTVAGTSSTSGIKVCFEGSSGAPKYLKKCNKNLTVLPCATVAPVVGGVQATIVVAPGDPRFRINGIATLVESPSSVASKGVIGKTLKIKGTDLLGPNGQSEPMVGFTSVNGSTVIAKITSITAELIDVTVPNGAATGPIDVAWPNETVVSDGSIAIKA